MHLISGELDIRAVIYVEAKQKLFVPQGTVRCLWFLWFEYLACGWLQLDKHSKHILGVHAFISTAVTKTVF